MRKKISPDAAFPFRPAAGDLMFLGKGHATFSDHRERSQEEKALSSRISGQALQFRRQTIPPWTLLSRKDPLIKDENDEYVYDIRAGDEEKRRQVWTNLQETYEACRIKGAGLWQQLNQKVEEVRRGFFGKQRLEKGLKEKRKEKGYSRTYKEHYLSKYIPVDDEPGVYTTQSGGFVDGPQGVNYSYTNILDTEKGKITAWSNYGNKDPARDRDKDVGAGDGEKIGLPNSELIWEAYSEAARNSAGLFKGRHVKKSQKKLDAFKCIQVSNVTTHKVVYMAYDDGEDWETDKTFHPGTDEFNALLGTANGARAAFILLNHMDEVDWKTIRDIRAWNGDKLEVNFEKIE